MEKDEFQELWQSAQHQLARAAQAGQQHTLDIAQLKVASELGSLRLPKAVALALGIGWVVLLDAVLLRGWPWANWFFLVSAAIQVLLTQAVIGIYLYQLLLLQRVDTSATVVATQYRIARLQATTLWSFRLSALQLPCWTTFYLSTRLLEHAPPGWLLLQASVTLLAIFAAAWLFGNLTYENRHKRWFQWLLKDPEWQPLVRSLHLLEQLAAYQAPPDSGIPPL